MNFILFSIFTIYFHETTFVEGKIDTDILLVIESSYQNQDYDILCALREALSSLSGQGNFSQRDVNLTLSYIDLLHDCFANKLSITAKIENQDMSALEEDIVELEEFLGEQNDLGIDYNEHGEAEEFKQRMEEASNIHDRATMNVTSLKSSFIGISVVLIIIAGLFFVGVCFAGRIVVKSCKGRWSRSENNAVAESTSFTFEKESV